jgi:hypothetical protein
MIRSQVADVTVPNVFANVNVLDALFIIILPRLKVPAPLKDGPGPEEVIVYPANVNDDIALVMIVFTAKSSTDEYTPDTLLK